MQCFSAMDVTMATTLTATRYCYHGLLYQCEERGFKG